MTDVGLSVAAGAIVSLIGANGAGKATTRAFRACCGHVLERFPRLRERLSQPAGLLSGGEQQMLAIAGP